MTHFENKLVFGEDMFSVLFRNFFDDNTFFTPLAECKPKYPIDIYKLPDSLGIEIAVVGLDKEDIDIEILDGQTLNISYNKEEDKGDCCEYLHKGITRKSFSHGWKIDSKYDLNNISAEVDKGLLTIEIPLAPDLKPKKINIK